MVASLFATLAHTKSVPLTGGFLEAHSPAVAEEKFLRRLCYSFIELSRSVFRVLFSLSLTAVMAFAQVDTGTPANTTSENDGRVTINLSNLNIHVDIPLRSSNARNLFAKVTMSTDSSIQKLGTTLSHSNVLSVSNNLTTTQLSPDPYGPDGPPCGYTFAYVVLGVKDSFNTLHKFPSSIIVAAGLTCGIPFTGSGTTSDGQYYSSFHVTSNWILVTDSLLDSAGNSYAPPNLTDPNGNTATVNTDSSGHNYVDASGQTFLSAPFNSNTFTYAGPGGVTEPIAVTYTSYTFGTAFSCSGLSNAAAISGNAVTQLSLPDNSFYAFTYEVAPGNANYYTGRLASVQLPTGGTISYNYSGGTGGINCADGSTAGFTKVTPDGTWTYTHSISGNYGTTQVTAPHGSYTIYNFPGPYEVQRQVFSSSGTLIAKNDHLL